MAHSKRKTTVAVLRGILGQHHGQEGNFAKLTKRSPSWVKKVSADIIPLSEDAARRIAIETGVALGWLMGSPEKPPVGKFGEPYNRQRFEQFRSEAKAGKTGNIIGSAWAFVPAIAAIGSAAAERGSAPLFAWRLRTFLQKSAEEFGWDVKALNTAASALHKAPGIKKLFFSFRNRKQVEMILADGLPAVITKANSGNQEDMILPDGTVIPSRATKRMT